MGLQRAARAILKPVSAAFDVVRPPPVGVTVLIYHRVGAGSQTEVDLDPGVFDDQMAELADSGRVMTLDDAVSALADSDPSGSAVGEVDGVVVTFDDGTPDLVDNVLPILEQHQIPATLYLATEHVESGVGFWDPADRAMTWGAVVELGSSGLVDVGSHTHRHALLDRLGREAVVDELDRSIDLIGEHVGRRPRHFAYPKALSPNEAADHEVRKRFVSAAVAGTKPNVAGRTDVHLLARSPIQRSDDMGWFRRKARGGMGAEDRVRGLVNRRRYAGATS